MFAAVKLIGAEQNVEQITANVVSGPTVINVPLFTIVIVVCYLIGVWISLFIDGLVDDEGLLGLDDDVGWILAVVWPITWSAIAGILIGICIKKTFNKLPGRMKTILTAFTLLFRPIKAGRMLSAKFRNKGGQNG